MWHSKQRRIARRMSGVRPLELGDTQSKSCFMVGISFSANSISIAVECRHARMHPMAMQMPPDMHVMWHSGSPIDPAVPRLGNIQSIIKSNPLLSFVPRGIRRCMSLTRAGGKPRHGYSMSFVEGAMIGFPRIHACIHIHRVYACTCSDEGSMQRGPWQLPDR